MVSSVLRDRSISSSATTSSAAVERAVAAISRSLAASSSPAARRSAWMRAPSRAMGSSRSNDWTPLNPLLDRVCALAGGPHTPVTTLWTGIVDVNNGSRSSTNFRYTGVKATCSQKCVISIISRELEVGESAVVPRHGVMPERLQLFSATEYSLIIRFSGHAS